MTITEPNSAGAAFSADRTASRVIKPAGEGAKLHDSAIKFEALLIAQMLKTARESSSGGALGGDQTDTTMLEMAEQCFSEVLASKGGMGLGRLIEQRLLPVSNPDSSTPKGPQSS